MSVEPHAAGTGGNQRGDWVIPLIVLVVALAIVAILVFAGLSLLGGTADETPHPSGAPSEASATASAVAPTESEAAASPTDSGETSVFDLEVGDCFSAESDQLDTVLVVDCAQPHEYEAFHVFDHDAGADAPYPGDDALFDFADTECQPPFEEFVGHDYQTSIWYITSLTPSEETWADGDREIVCTLNQQDENAEPISVTGSAEGAAE